MSSSIRFDHVGITVADLDRAVAFFVALGLEIEGRTFVEGEFSDTVTGIPNSRSEIAMLRLAADGYPLIGGIGEYEGIWKMAYIRGPEGITVALAERTSTTS